MAFNPLMAGVVKDISGKSVCEFGNQRYMGGEGFKSTKDYYFSLGYERYVALDVNEAMDAVICDLNEPVDLGETFDLVTNNGTGEHIFDQRRIFENAHNLSHRWIVHILPMGPWVNHGFFNFNPILFRDLAFANDYDATIYIANRWGQTVALGGDELFREKKPKRLERAMDEIGGDVSCVAVFKKTTEQAFRLPFQGKYQRDIADQELRERYG
jgi:hypothetical protein